MLQQCAETTDVDAYVIILSLGGGVSGQKRLTDSQQLRREMERDQSLQRTCTIAPCLRWKTFPSRIPSDRHHSSGGTRWSRSEPDLLASAMSEDQSGLAHSTMAANINGSCNQPSVFAPDSTRFTVSVDVLSLVAGFINRAGIFSKVSITLNYIAVLPLFYCFWRERL